jgi:hypothetical protein
MDETMDSDEQRLLAAMPLHAITARYGETGLRERFALETAGFPGPDRRRLDQALELAARLHAADRRQREPYLNHLLRVAIRIIRYYDVRDPDVICAALLHDSVEDHAAELAGSQPGTHAGGQPGSQADGEPGTQAALAALAAQFGDRVADLVGAVTNPDYEPGRDTREQYRDHVLASLDANPRARIIKISDFTDNGVGLIHTSGPRAAQLAAKYAPLVPALRELIARPDTPLSEAVKAHILGQLDRAAQRFSSLSM